MSSSPLVGCVHITRLSPVISSPHVLPPFEEYCSNAEPSGLKRTTPLPIGAEVFRAVAGFHMTGAVAVRGVDPAVPAPARIVDDGVRVAGAEAGVELLDFVALAVPVGVAQPEDVRRLRDDHAVLVKDEAGDEFEALVEDAPFCPSRRRLCSKERMLILSRPLTLAARRARGRCRRGPSTPCRDNRGACRGGHSDTRASPRPTCRPAGSQSKFIGFVISGSEATSLSVKSGWISSALSVSAGRCGPPSG